MKDLEVLAQQKKGEREMQCFPNLWAGHNFFNTCWNEKSDYSIMILPESKLQKEPYLGLDNWDRSYTSI